MEGGNGGDGQQSVSRALQIHPSDEQGTTIQQAPGTSVQQAAEPVKPSRSRVGRKSTRMARMTTRNPNKVRLLFDNRLLMPIGPSKMNMDNWSSYLGFLGRKEPSILICSWKKVPEATKELVWQGILESLEEQESSGSFKGSGKNDLLVVAIGKPDHPGRVRGVGRRYTVSSYFGRQRQPSGMVSREEFNNTIAEMEKKSREQFDNTIAEMEKKVQMIMSSQTFSSREPLTPVVESAKGSNLSAAQNIMEFDENNDEHDHEYELYVEDPQRRLVAYGQIHDLGSNIHNNKMKADEVRVTVVRVVVEDAQVPFPTDEVTTVGEAPQNFIVWPKIKVGRGYWSKAFSQKELFPKPESQPNTQGDILRTLWFTAADVSQPEYVSIEAGVVSLKKVDAVYINQEDIMGMLVSRKISISVMQFYNRYLYTLLSNSERTNKYGLISQLHGNWEEMLQTRIGEGDFECFLAPIYETNWQLMVLCPKYNYVAWFCFMQNRPTKRISTKIETALNAYQVMKGTHARQLKKLKWVYPKCCGQGQNAECGLFVMRHMLEIIKLDIVDSFEKVFNMNAPYSENDINVVRRHWAEGFLEVMSEK
ncbi:Proteasome subunit beta type-3 [Castilleja foliolosa]|uniref:Proteasome subunit beta type-3 n=1 Tax=Castilleja foliolosa TaxID=1961234 RepID=A0ABD3EL74_9LAMI